MYGRRPTSKSEAMAKPKRKDHPPPSAEPDGGGDGVTGSRKKHEGEASIPDQVRQLRRAKGVGSPEDMRLAAPNKEKAAKLSEYTITVEGVFGPEDDILDIEEDAIIDDELRRLPEVQMFTWTGAMGKDCVASPGSMKGSDRLQFDIPKNTSSDNFSFDHFRIYVTSPSKRATYKLFEFDCMKMTCTNTEMCLLGSSSSWTTRYNEYKKWSLPYRHKNPERGIQLVVSVCVGDNYDRRMIGLDWYSGRTQLDEAQVLAYLNGDEVVIE